MTERPVDPNALAATPVHVRDEPEDGARLLEELHSALHRYVVFPSDEAIHVVVLWVAATHAMPEWQHATRLVITSPEKRCGKSRLLDLIEATASNSLVSANATAASIFRSLNADGPPTLLIDEADSVFTRRNGMLSERAEDLRGLLNAGFQRARPMLRCVGPQQTPTPFATFAMVALAAIGRDSIPDTILDRAVVIGLERRAPGEHVESFRLRRDVAPLRVLGGRLRDWIGAHRDELAYATPTLPLEDRAADTWEPLVAVADLAGGTWPRRARDAALMLTSNDDRGEEALSLALLADLRAVFADIGRPVLASAVVVDALRALPESPWGAFEFTQRDLARRLRPYGVAPRQVRPDGSDSPQVRGYRLADLEPVFVRYLPPIDLDPDRAEGPSPSVTVSRPVPGNGLAVTDTEPVTDGSVTDAGGVTRDPSNGAVCDDVTDCDGTPAEDLDEVYQEMIYAAVSEEERYTPTPDWALFAPDDPRRWTR